MQDYIIEWLLESGGLPLLGLIAGTLIALQAVFTFLLWRKGEKSYFLPFLSYTIATAALIIGSISYIGALSHWSQETVMFTLSFFVITAIVAASLHIFHFIMNTWISKEEKA